MQWQSTEDDGAPAIRYRTVPHEHPPKISFIDGYSALLHHGAPIGPHEYIREMAAALKVQCCIVGGGPAGMILGYLLGRAGVACVVLEKHADFLRDFRGDTVHPSTLRVMSELGLLDEFLRLPHSQLHSLSADIVDREFRIADFRHLPAPGNFIALMPQWDFLNFLSAKASRYPALKILMSTHVTGLIEAGSRVVGVQAMTTNGALEVRAALVVGCDGRHSTVRSASGLKVRDLGSPIDVLWFRLSKQTADPGQVLAHVSTRTMLITIDRNQYWQCAIVIAKGGLEELTSKGLDAFRQSIAAGARFLANRVDEIRSFDDVKLLSVSVDRLEQWCRPGLLCIGDAAHAMSPIGGVGINLAIQDAVATANQLWSTLRAGTPTVRDLENVRRRRLLPVRVIQGLQVAIQNRVLKPMVAGENRTLEAPWPLRMLDGNAWLRRWPAQLIGMGVRPEHVRSPELESTS